MLLGLHTYSLNLHGIGQKGWAGGFTLPWSRQLSTFELMDLAVRLGLDGLHLDDGVLETLERSFLEEVRAAAQERNLYIEYNFSLDIGNFGIGIQNNLEEAITISHILGADIIKMSMDLRRPRPVTASRFSPEVMEKITLVSEKLKQSIPSADAAGIKIAVENHCDSYSDEILWLLDKVNHPVVGACIDTVNALHVMEAPMTAIQNLTPRAYTNHFRDNKIVFERYGFTLTGTPVGEGDIDMKKAYELFKTQSTMRRINIETDVNIPLDNMETALRMEMEVLERSIRYCRDILEIKREAVDK